MKGLSETFDRWSSRAANLYTFWPLLAATGAGIFAFQSAKAVEWISQWGPFGWFSAAVVAFFLAAMGMYAGAAAYDRIMLAQATRKWSKDVDSVNPLALEFQRLRLRIQEISHPFTGRITRKRFIDCEILGPATLTFRGGLMQNCITKNCDIVVVRHDAKINNTLALEDCTLIGCEIQRCTLYLLQNNFDHQLAEVPNINLISYRQGE